MIPQSAILAANVPDDAPHLLLVDDDRRIRDLLSRYLAGEGYRITSAASAADARKHLEHLAFDLFILDVMMPGESGLDFAAWLRRTDSQFQRLPIVMLTARSETADRVRGLEAGVDDYLGKPFEPRELSLRIASILRRAAPQPTQPLPEIVRFGAFTFSFERGELRDGDQLIRISDREREMLRMLAAVPGGSVSREALAGNEPGANPRTVDVQVNRLRRKIEKDPAEPVYLQTVRGTGYRLVLEGQSGFTVT
ncbi:MAG: response regulator transcription factor [Hyphomicrobiales bacterium]|nr:response regulator transcription factor [Hyphomicrobiales bacterium]MDE2113599.1 response regulator transcription factor [Hyphomicrobiales bacterium]